VGKSVLLVDINKDASKVTGAILENAGFDVSLAPGTPEALAALKAAPADLVIYDSAKDAGGAVEFCKQLSSEIEGADGIPLLIVTGDEAVLKEIMVLAAGGCDSVAKPFKKSVLIEKAAGLIRSKGGKEEA